MIRSLQLAFYKGMGGKHGAIQFAKQDAHYYCLAPDCKRKVWHHLDSKPPMCPDHAKEMKTREGSIFINITSAKGLNEYDWDKKIVFSLSVVDMGKVLLFLERAQAGEELSLLHDPGAKTPNQGKIIKTVKFSSPKGLTEGVMIMASEKTTVGTVSHVVPLSGDEVKTLAVCIRAFIPTALGW